MGATKITWLGDKGSGMRSWSCSSCSLSTILAASRLMFIRWRILGLSLPLPIFFFYFSDCETRNLFEPNELARHCRDAQFRPESGTVAALSGELRLSRQWRGDWVIFNRFASYIHRGLFTHWHTHWHTHTDTHTHTHTLTHSGIQTLIDCGLVSCPSWLGSSNCKWESKLIHKVDSLQLIWSKLNPPFVNE